MGEIKTLLEEAKNLITETENILRNEFDYESDIKNISIDNQNEIIIIEDKVGKCFQHDVYDSYTSLIKIIKNYSDEKIIKNYKRLKEISQQAELY